MTSDVPGAFPTLGAFVAIVSGLRREGICDREIAEAAIGTGVSLSRPQASGPSRTVFEVNVSGARGNTEIMAMVEAGVRRGIERNNSDVLPSLVSRVVSDPRVSG